MVSLQPAHILQSKLEREPPLEFNSEVISSMRWMNISPLGVRLAMVRCSHHMCEVS